MKTNAGPRPPAVARWILERLSPAHDRPFVLSDLAEEFEARAEAEGLRKARRWYRAQVLRSVPPTIARRLREARPFSGAREGARLFGLGGDVRYALRRLAATPVQVVVTVVSLGIGIGLATSVFAVANAFLLQPPRGITDTEGLVALYTSEENGRLYGANSYPDLEDVTRESGVFRDLAAVRPGLVRWTEGDGTRRVMIEIVGGSYFDVLGVDLPLGRTFTPQETVVGGAAAVTVVSHEFWKTRLGGDPSVLGRTLRMDGRDFTVIGVAPEGLLGRFLRLKVDAWVPVGLPGGIYHATEGELGDRGAREYMAFARLRPGVSIEQAQARLTVVATRLREEHAEAWTDDHGAARSLTVLPERDSRIPPDGRTALAATSGFLLGGTGLILLIACLNVAGLFLARTFGRRREIAVRLSLGAARARVVRLLLVEALLLALAGGALGVALASLTARFLGALPFPLDIPLSFGVSVDTHVLVFALVTAFLACLAFGLGPAIRASRADLASAVKSDRTGGRLRFGSRGVLVTVQVAGSLILLVGTGLCLRSTGALSAFDSGLHPEGIALASWTNREATGEDDVRHQVLSLAERLTASPDIEEVAVASVAELSLWTDNASATLSVDGYRPESDRDVVVRRNVVTPNYFAMVGLKPVRGRTLAPTDDAGAPTVAVVNETFVRTYWPGESGLGRRVTVREARSFGKPFASPNRTFEVVGVLPDVVVAPGAEPEPYLWTSFLQDYTPLVVFHARGRTGAAAAVPALRSIVQADPDELPLVPARTYEDLASFNALAQRLALQAFSWSGAFALLLALMGIYGIVAFSVGQRAREMAIRQAVGAARGTVVRSIVLYGVRIVAIGSALGLAVAVPLASVARSTLYGVSPMDPLALIGSVSVLLATALAATLLPARRAAHIDPMRILREE